MKNNPIELQITVPNQTRYLSLIGRISEELTAQVENYTGDLDALANHINVVLTEALVNAIRHANSGNPDEVVTIRITITENEILLQVFDHGMGFDLDKVLHDAPTETDELEDHGRGLYIIRSLMDSVDYYKIEGGNVLEMHKRFR
jgi:serine/threonine-protein kinase RsbW